MGKEVSIVLAGGGARGIAHIGVIEELEAQGYHIHAVTGTSMGALVGGIYALGKLDAYKEWLYNLDELGVFKLLDFTLSGQGFVKGDRVFNTLQDFIEDVPIQDLQKRFTAVATDIINKEEVIFQEGSIFKAMRASIAIPTVFTPVKTENGLLVDGGVLNNLPVNHAPRKDGDLLIAVDINAEIPQVHTEPEPQTEEELSTYAIQLQRFQTQLQNLLPFQREEKLGFFELINQTLNVMMYQIAKLTYDQRPPDFLIEIPVDACGIFDFYKAKEMVNLGRKAAKEQLAKFIDQQES